MMKLQKPRHYHFFLCCFPASLLYYCAVLLLLLTVVQPAAATWSVVGVDTATRQVGAAGATCRVSGIGLSVLEDYGAVAGVGAFAAQADADNPSDNSEISRLMAGGQTPAQILDPAQPFIDDSDQFGVVTLNDNPDSYTGGSCDPVALDARGSVSDYKYSIQGNRLTGADVVRGAEDEFRRCGSGDDCNVCDDLADRLMRAMEAGAGGVGNSRGDSRCIVDNPIAIPRAATSAYLQVENDDGTKYADLNVRFQTLYSDAVFDLRQQYEQWRVTHPCPSKDEPPFPGWGICFSGRNTVEVRSKGEISMDRLQIGDFVQSSSQGAFSRVYSFAHRDHEKQAAFVQITTNNATTLEISNDHILFVNNKATRAKDVAIGDRVGGAQQVVASVKTVHRRGLFAPLTESGAIVVSGVPASSYVAVLDIDPALQARLYHAMLFPLRAICAVRRELCAGETYTDGVSDKFHGGLELGQFVGGLGQSVQLVLFLLCFPILSVVASTDWLLPSPVLFTTLLMAWLVYRKVTRTKSINSSTSKA